MVKGIYQTLARHVTVSLCLVIFIHLTYIFHPSINVRVLMSRVLYNIRLYICKNDVRVYGRRRVVYFSSPYHKLCINFKCTTYLHFHSFSLMSVDREVHRNFEKFPFSFVLLYMCLYMK